MASCLCGVICCLQVLSVDGRHGNELCYLLISSVPVHLATSVLLDSIGLFFTFDVFFYGFTVRSVISFVDFRFLVVVLVLERT